MYLPWRTKDQRILNNLVLLAISEEALKAAEAGIKKVGAKFDGKGHEMGPSADPAMDAVDKVHGHLPEKAKDILDKAASRSGVTRKDVVAAIAAAPSAAIRGLKSACGAFVKAVRWLWKKFMSLFKKKPRGKGGAGLASQAASADPNEKPPLYRDPPEYKGYNEPPLGSPTKEDLASQQGATIPVPFPADSPPAYNVSADTLPSQSAAELLKEGREARKPAGKLADEVQENIEERRQAKSGGGKSTLSIKDRLLQGAQELNDGLSKMNEAAKAGLADGPQASAGPTIDTIQAKLEQGLKDAKARQAAMKAMQEERRGS